MMKQSHAAALLCAATLALAACSREPEPQETAEPPSGSAGQLGRQIDQALGELQQRAQEAGAQLGDRLIEAGQSLQEHGGRAEQ